jgi:hypothetical protein
MNNHFHKILNRMVLFTALIVAGLIMFWDEFLGICLTNIWLNGIIIGVVVFGIASCFFDVFRLVPEYKWLKNFFYSKPGAPIPQLPPFVLRPVAKMLTSVKLQQKTYISSQTLNSFLDIIIGRFDDQRDQHKYITNILIFLGLLGTFWGLLHTIGTFGGIINTMSFDVGSADAAEAMRNGLSAPLSGMGTAFSSSFLGLAGSLIVGFLTLQTTLAQNAIFRELEENLSSHTKLFGYLSNSSTGEETILPYIQSSVFEMTKAAGDMTKNIKDLNKHIRERDRALANNVAKLSRAVESIKGIKKNAAPKS